MRHAPPIAEDGRLGSFLRALPTVSRFVRVTQNAVPSVRDRTDAEAHSGVCKDTSADIVGPDALASPAQFWRRLHVNPSARSGIRGGCSVRLDHGLTYAARGKRQLSARYSLLRGTNEKP